MNPNLPIALYAIGYLVLFGGWLTLVLAKTPGADTLVEFIQATLGALTGHVLTMINPRAQSAPPATSRGDKQAGRAMPFLLLILAIGAALAMGGCATQFQALTALNTSAVVSARAASDLQAKVAAEQFCLMPVDTLGRNPSYVKAVQDLCWSGSQTTPSDAAATMQLQSATTLATPAGMK